MSAHIEVERTGQSRCNGVSAYDVERSLTWVCVMPGPAIGDLCFLQLQWGQP
jgi:hypothetical protein